MVPPERVTSTLTLLLAAIALSYAAFPVNCVYGCGNCNQTPMVLCDANEACGPGLPTCPAPCGAPGDQSFDISDRAFDLNVSVWLTSTRTTPCQGFDSADDTQGFSELTKAFSQLLAVDVEPLLEPWCVEVSRVSGGVGQCRGSVEAVSVDTGVGVSGSVGLQCRGSVGAP